MDSGDGGGAVEDSADGVVAVTEDAVSLKSGGGTMVLEVGAFNGPGCVVVVVKKGWT